MTLRFTALELGSLTGVVLLAFAASIGMAFNIDAIALSFGASNAEAGLVASAELAAVSVGIYDNVPVLDLDRLVRRVRAALVAHAPAARLVVFGHLAEGNLHVNVLGAGEAAPALKDAILQAAIDLGGTISAEHGIGVAKTAWMERLHGPAHLSAMQAVKHALDPHAILNPGVLLPT